MAVATTPGEQASERDGRRQRPAIVVVDDEPAVLAAVARDLRRAFGERYRIVRAGSGDEALGLLRELVARGDQVALLIADQRMPEMPGTDYLVAARRLVPGAKRVLLTAYADTSAAIQAINEVALDYYLLKPWDPPEEQLYPVVEDLLTTWESGAALEAGGVRLVGHRFSKDSHDLRDFLARNRVPARWLDVERDGEARELLTVAGVGDDGLPVALLEDGSVLERPTVLELAERLGVTAQPASDHYDLVIVGGGPAGLAAAVYGASEGLRTVMVEREAPGGQAGQSSRIENYLGFPNGLSGSDLARRATDQARRLGAELLTVQDAMALEVQGAGRSVRLSGGAALSANCVLVASGVSYRQLDCPGFAELTGAGIYYGAAMTEARACKDQHVVVIGGANSAGQAAVYFSEYAGRVTMLARSPLEKSMSHYLIAQLAALPNVDVRTGAVAIGAEGEDEHLSALHVRDAQGTETVEAVDACFVFIGAAPRTDWLQGVVARDERGFILAGADAKATGWPLKRDPYLLETSVPGVFVAGDVRARSIKRVASAVGEGSMAVSLIHEYLAQALTIAELTAADLRPVDLFDDLDDAALAPWAAAAEPYALSPGDVIVQPGEPAPGLIVLLDGRARTLLVDGLREEPLGHQEAPTWIGAIAALTGGELGVRMRCETDCRLARIPTDRFTELVLASPPVHRLIMQRISPVMTRLTTIESNRERLASLGTMAAGLAHELNNPAAAAKRAASDLVDALETVSGTIRAFVETGIERSDAERLVQLHDEALERNRSSSPTGLDAADAEDAMLERLEDLGVPEAWRLAEPLASAGLDEEWLAQVAALAGPATGPALRWVAASLTARNLACELRDSAERMGSLVGAVKTYAYMDRGSLVEADLHEGLDSTLVILGHKLKNTKISVVRDYDPALPKLTVRGSELNQVWTNLIHNAIDALGDHGTITIRTRLDGECAQVDVADDGPGIPEDARPRVLEPFYTTKAVGSGTGLGLDTCRRIVEEGHGGSISFDTSDAGTTFHVRLPLRR